MISPGSQWHRWEPHIHAPGTVLNDRFRGSDPWDVYLTRIETKTPLIRALAVTDYYLTDLYEQVLQYKEDGRLPHVDLIFPNIEMRLDVSAKSGFVNIHLLVSPENTNHVRELRRFLSRLHFQAHKDSFNCTRDDLIRLGKFTNSAKSDESSALREGATQFKVNFTLLRAVYDDSAWAKENILIAVAGGSGDGTSGIRAAADATVRQEIERFADIIFASSSAHREFWLGQSDVSEADLRKRYRGLKPCLHGSDAHDEEHVGEPFEDRYTWIKGRPTFDTLRQACTVPAGRAYIGPKPPSTAMPSQVISCIQVENAKWAGTPELPLNPGLVTIIGARGSGKTALVEMIATGCNAVPETVWQAGGELNSSFLARARSLLGDATVRLVWGGGNEIARALDGRDSGAATAFPRARYLSQQFVEELCSAAHGPADSLVAEIERVIFQSHDQDARDGALSFAELRQQRTQRFQQARARDTTAIVAISQRISDEHEKERLIPSVKQQVEQKSKLIADYRSDLSKLAIKGSEAEIKRHGELQAVTQTKRTHIAAVKAQRRTFETLQDEVSNMRATTSPEMLRQTQARHPQSGLNEKRWAQFLLDYKGPVEESLDGYIKWANERIAQLTGTQPSEPPPGTPYIVEGVDPNSLGLVVLTAEITRLESLFKTDKLIRDQYSATSQRIAREERELQTLKTRLAGHEGAAVRRTVLQQERADTYERVFDAIIAEEVELAALYAPLRQRLGAASGTLSKLQFSVFRSADAASWAENAEETLLDRRQAGDFKGRGSLVEKAVAELKPVWETGSAADANQAMNEFISRYQSGLLAHAPVPPAQHDAFRTWLRRFARWLFSTDHLSVRYGIAYDGVDISKLSPGTRGIVLLLLYLALDDADDRPLIIDQPEENLDPKSVFDELVSLFVVAKEKRQVIMVTHNANLVINTDADQVIVADAGPHPDGGLPRITYQAGGLEDAEMRKAVCDILEGGEHAFRERARRLRVQLER